MKAQPPYLFEGVNEIGIFMVENPTAESAQDDACYMGSPGQFTAYCVLTNPQNTNLGTPITTLGGFEFRLVYPPGLIVTPTIHPSARNFMAPPDFFCGAAIQVVGVQCTLVTLTIDTFTADPAALYLAPVSYIGIPVIHDTISVSDFDDNYSISQAFPTTYDFDVPVFGIFDCADVVPTEEANWGSVKAMFR